MTESITKDTENKATVAPQPRSITLQKFQTSLEYFLGYLLLAQRRPPVRGTTNETMIAATAVFISQVYLVVYHSCMAKLTAEGNPKLEPITTHGKAGRLTLTTYPPTVVITEAMASAGVDTAPMAAAIMKLSSHEQKALEDQSMTPDELKVPRPAGYNDERAANLASSFASGIRENRQAMWVRWLAVAGIITTIVVAVL